ncbi:hypothetical protein N7493_000558 [Penicillium malachiteum]|uniref:Ankyrin n=1 Tax=Penicillium malachiteum TaxID=1324776 RepID=A0AAD6HWJ2_9EURO|nr:hypothetical protein N7493_000558 [Penicillium malachiteum]
MSTWTLPDPDQTELVPLLSDLITLGLTTEVQALAKRFHSLDTNAQRSLLEQAAYAGPLPMVKTLYFACDEDACNTKALYGGHVIHLLAHSALLGENLEVLEWLTPKFTKVCTNPEVMPKNYFQMEFFCQGADSDSQETFEAWKKVVLQSWYADQDRFSLYENHLLPTVMSRAVINTVKDPMKLERLAALWDEIIPSAKLTKYTLGSTLNIVAASTCSTALAQVLLKAGADVDFRYNKGSGTDSTKKTPLHLASRKVSREAAELMKLLLLWGADPNVKARTFWSCARTKPSKDKNNRPRRTIDMERGTQKIERYLGMSWERLVEWAQEQRHVAASTRSGAYEPLTTPVIRM